MTWAVGVVAEDNHHVSPGGALGGGREACIHLIEGYDDRGRRHAYVAKIFRSRTTADRTENAGREFEALALFASAVPEGVDIVCPTPVRLRATDPPVILSTFVDGDPLGSYLRRTRPDTVALRTLARQVLGSLGLYHEATGEPYGEFHARNILCGAGRVWLIDPATPSPGTRPLLREASSPAAADLGYVLYHLVTDWRTRVVRPATWLWCRRFVRELFVEAARSGATGDGPLEVPVATTEDVLTFTERCLADLERRRGLRGRILARFARNSARRIVQRISTGPVPQGEPPGAG